jgi:hypothetical protein
MTFRLLACLIFSAPLPSMAMSPETAALESILPGAAALEAEAPDSTSVPPPRPFGHFGLSLKSGEAAGVMGIQVAWNFDRHLQVNAGAGGMTDLDVDLLFLKDRSRTDSYYLLGKVYWDHLYLSTGYSLKVSQIEMAMDGGVFTASKSEQGIPFHLGYEFGHRMGFYYSTSVGYLYVIGGGNRDVAKGTILGSSKSRTAKSGPSFGMSIGYYLW